MREGEGMTRETSPEDKTVETVWQIAAQKAIQGAPDKSGTGRDPQAGGAGGRSGSLVLALAPSRDPVPPTMPRAGRSLPEVHLHRVVPLGAVRQRRLLLRGLHAAFPVCRPHL